MKKTLNNFDIETLIYQYLENNKDIDAVQLMDKLVSGNQDSWWILGMTCLGAIVMQLIYNSIHVGEIAATGIQVPDFLNIVLPTSQLYTSIAESARTLGDIIPEARDLAWYANHPREYTEAVAQNWTRDLRVFPNFSADYRWNRVAGTTVRDLVNYANTWMINHHTDFDSFMVAYMLVTPMESITLDYDDLVIMFRVTGVTDPDQVADFSLVQFLHSFNIIIMNTDAINPTLLSGFSLIINQLYDYNDIPRVQRIIDDLAARNVETDREMVEIDRLPERTEEQEERFNQRADLLLTRYRVINILNRLIQLLSVRFPRT